MRTSALVAASCLALCAPSFAQSPRAADITASAIPGVVPPDHVVIVIEENKAYSQIIGSSAAPYINGLAAQGASMTQSHGVRHPSEPNYLALFSGSTQGLTDDSCPHTYSGANLGSELLGAGLTFAGYSEDLPSTGSTVCSSGKYFRKHNPWVNFTNVPSTANKPFTSFPTTFTSLPTLSFVVPNQDNDMHDGTIGQADTWLKQRLDGYVQWAKTHNSLLVLTFDEDDGSEGNRIVTLFVGPMVKKGQYAQTVNHYNVLRTLEDLYGLPHAGSAGTATPITNIWSTGATPTATPTATATATATATPTQTACPGSCPPIEITPPASRVTASANDGNVPGNTVDNTLETRWSANGDGAWIRYDLGFNQNVAFVRIAVYNGNARRNRFDLQGSNDGTAWANILTGAQSGGTSTLEETFDFPDVQTRYVRYLGHGSNVGTFNSLTEVSVFGGVAVITPTATPAGTPTATPTPTPTATATATATATPSATSTATPTTVPPYVEVTPGATAVTASTNDGNVPANAVDGNLGTRWSGSGDGAWIRFDLGAPRTLDHVTIATFSGNMRRSRFDLQVSNDSASWTTVLAGGQTSGTTTLEEPFDVGGASARYLRYVGHGNDDPAKAQWNSLTEVRLFAAP
jgi:hypothetical protein